MGSATLSATSSLASLTGEIATWGSTLGTDATPPQEVDPALKCSRMASVTNLATMATASLMAMTVVDRTLLQVGVNIPNTARPTMTMVNVTKAATMLRVALTVETVSRSQSMKGRLMEAFTLFSP